MPVADGGRLYVQSAKGEFRCLDAADQKVIWRKNFVDDFGPVYIGEKGKAAGASRYGATGSPINFSEEKLPLSLRTERALKAVKRAVRRAFGCAMKIRCEKNLRDPSAGGGAPALP